MRIAQLGVAIDSAGAKRGAAETNTALSGIATEAKKTTAALSAVSSSTQRVAAANTAAAKQIATDFQRSGGAVAASATQIVASLGKTGTGAADLKSEFAGLFAQIAAGRAQLSAIQAGATSAGATMSTASKGAGLFATALAPFGGPVGAAIIGGLALLPIVFDKIEASGKKAREQAKQFREELRGLSDDALRAAVATERAYQDQVRSTPQSARSRQSQIGSSDARLDVLGQEVGRRQTAAAVELGKALQQNQRDLLETAEAIKKFKEGGEQAADAYKKAASAWNDASGKGRTLGEAMRQGDTAAQALYRSSQQVVTATRTYQGVQDAATKATKDAEAAQKRAAEAAKDRQKAEQDLADALLASARDVFAKLAEAAQDEAKRRADGSKAIAKSIADREKENSVLRDQIAALQDSRAAYDALLVVQAQAAAVAEAQATAATAGLTLSEDEIAAIRAQVAEAQRLLTLKQALLDLDGKSPFAIPVEETKQWGDALGSVANTARDIAQIFGGVGTQLTKAVQLASQLVTSVRAASKASAAATAAKGTANEGSANAASRAANIAAGASFLTVSASVITAWSTSVRQAADAAREAAQQLKQLRLSARDQASQFSLSANGTPLERELSSIADSFESTLTALLAAGAPRIAGLGDRKAVNIVPTAATVEKLLADYDTMIAKAKEAAAFQLAQAEGELQVRALIAAGRTAEADAVALQFKQQQELRDASEKFGADSPYLAHLKDVQAAETAAAQAAEARRAVEQAQQRTAFGLDLTGRRQTLNGDTRGAFVTQQTISSNSALAQAQQLLDAGTITVAMFNELKTLLGDEMVAALAAFDVAAQQAKQTVLDDLTVRALVAEGRDSEAAQARIAIANAQELAGVTDKSLRAQIEYVQGLEAVARTAAAAAETQKKLYDIDTRMIDVLRQLDPAKAEELETARREIDRAKELDAAGSKLVATRLQELYAMEDAARAQAKLTAELQRQLKAAEDLANFTSSVEVDYLRATGRTFDADVKVLTEERDRRLKEAKQVGATQETIAQITAIFDAKYSALIAAQMSASAPVTALDTLAGVTGAAERTTLLGEDTVAVRSTRSITESTALQLVDYAASSTALLRRLVQLAEGGGGLGGLLGGPSLDRLDRQLGTRASTAALLLNGSVR